MADGESATRSVVVTYFPMFIATLSLVTSIYNGYLNGKFIDFIQRNVARVDYMHTCKEIIDAYFQVKFRASVIASGRDAASGGGLRATMRWRNSPRWEPISPIFATRRSAPNTRHCRKRWRRRCTVRPASRRPTSRLRSAPPTACS